MRKMIVVLMMLFCMFSVAALAASENTTEFTLQGGLMSNLKRAHVNPFLFTQLRHCDGEMITPEEQDTFRAGDKLCLDNDAAVDMSRVKEFFAFANSRILVAKTTKVATAPSMATVKITPAISASVVIEAVKKSEPKPAIRTATAKPSIETAPRKMTDEESSVLAVRRANAGCINSLEKIEDCRTRVRAERAKAQEENDRIKTQLEDDKKFSEIRFVRIKIAGMAILALATCAVVFCLIYHIRKTFKHGRYIRRHQKKNPNFAVTPPAINNDNQWIKDTAKAAALLRKNLHATQPKPSATRELAPGPGSLDAFINTAQTAPASSPVPLSTEAARPKQFIPGRSQALKPEYNWHILSGVAETRLRRKKIDGFAVTEQRDGLIIRVPSEAALEAAELSSHLQRNSAAPITVNQSAEGEMFSFELKPDTSLQYA